ncbi:MAG: hypothetical protein SCH71_04965 [Desulfobulbaceae bacterium]|nr:hypothetical protein [Desulfobulbaceae bacterium]
MAIKLKRTKHPLEKKAKQGFKGYPIGTIAYYGPDDKKATKVAAGIIMGENQEPVAMKKWFSTNDIRRETKIMNEIKDWFIEYKVRSVVMAPKILGCPHEEGIDYPEGEYCPECLFWKGRDRFTDEIIH